MGPRVFAVLRHHPESGERVLGLFNFTADPQVIELNEILDPAKSGKRVHDLLHGKYGKLEGGKMEISPYGHHWLKI